MPFRERVRRAFGRSPKDADSSENASSSKGEKEGKKKKGKKQDEQWEDWPEHIYKPHEMPRPKYRRPADPEHKAKLASFNWESATPPEEDPPRSQSHGSLYSPMGSRLPSRMGSFVSRLGKSRAQSRAQSRAGSVLAEGAEGEGEESETTNVGLSRYHTRSSTHSRNASTATSRPAKRMSSSRPTTGTGADHPPLAEDPHSSSSSPSNDLTVTAATPRAPLPLAVDGSEDAALDATGQGADLQHEATVTQESEEANRRRERASTVKHDQPFTQDELSRALTSLTVKAEPRGVAAGA